MKIKMIAVIVAAISLFWIINGKTQSAANQVQRPLLEYAFVRWDGFNNSYIIKPDNTVSFVGPDLKKLSRPNGVDERQFYQTAMMNMMANEGWRFLVTFHDDVILQREK